MVTYGTNPGMVAPISGRVPERPGDPAFAQSLQSLLVSPFSSGNPEESLAPSGQSLQGL
jgi:hypothetical protein